MPIKPSATSLLLTPEEHQVVVGNLPDILSGIRAHLAAHPSLSNHIATTVVSQVLESLHDGEYVQVGVLPEELTTTKAAAVIGVSRPTVLKMIAEGDLPATKVGTHHRLRTEDVLEVADQRKRAARSISRDMMHWEEELKTRAKKVR